MAEALRKAEQENATLRDQLAAYGDAPANTANVDLDSPGGKVSARELKELGRALASAKAGDVRIVVFKVKPAKGSEPPPAGDGPAPTTAAAE